MFNGMMDPELIRLAQEQMGRMSPTELARIQQQLMSNPELMRMASESMKSLRPEDLKHAAEQLKYTRPEEMAEIGEKMANATPEEIAAMRNSADAQIAYEINAAQMLKKQGNELHSQGRYKDALEKYLLAKKNLKGLPASKGRTLLMACSLNLMSCYLKTKQYDECIREGTEVLSWDANNLKALYRRGQAYKELGQLEDAVSDFSKASDVFPDDETVANVLRDAKETLMKKGVQRASRGVILEEITEEEQSLPSEKNGSLPTKYSVSQPQETVGCSKSQIETNGAASSSNSEYLQTLKEDPESIRSFQNFISSADPETLAALSGGKTDGISPDMVKTASNMISKMSPQELQKMIQLASSFQGKEENPYLKKGSPDSNFNSFSPGSLPTYATPDMLKTATDMMTKMSPEELQKMFEMASSLKGKDSMSAAAASHSNRLRSDGGSKIQETRENFTLNENHVGESGSSQQSFNLTGSPQSSFSSFAADPQELMKNQMKDPAMRQMFSSMIKSMSPEMMASMSEQFGMKISREDAEKAQQSMSSLSPDDLDKMMRWVDRIQRGVEGARKTKKWLLGRPGMILAVVMLVLAFVLHWFGFIGK